MDATTGLGRLSLELLLKVDYRVQADEKEMFTSHLHHLVVFWVGFMLPGCHNGADTSPPLLHVSVSSWLLSCSSRSEFQFEGGRGGSNSKEVHAIHPVRTQQRSWKG